MIEWRLIDTTTGMPWCCGCEKRYGGDIYTFFGKYKEKWKGWQPPLRVNVTIKQGGCENRSNLFQVCMYMMRRNIKRSFGRTSVPPAWTLTSLPQETPSLSVTRRVGTVLVLYWYLVDASFRLNIEQIVFGLDSTICPMPDAHSCFSAPYHGTKRYWS